jgi:hypothetical protein
MFYNILINLLVQPSKHYIIEFLMCLPLQQTLLNVDMTILCFFSGYHCQQ